MKKEKLVINNYHLQ